MRILGIDPLADPVAVKRRIGVVPEDLALFDRLTGEETLTLRRRRSTASTRDGARAALARPADADGPERRRHDAGHRLLARHAQEAVARGRAAAGAAAALPRRAVRRHRRGRLAPDQGPAAVVRRARRHDLPHLAHPRDRRAALDAHRRHRRRAGSSRRARSTTCGPAPPASARSRSSSSAWSAASARPPRRSTGSERPLLRILRAFAWMRWRVLVNSLERTGSRDTLRAPLARDREARPDHRRGAADPVGARRSPGSAGYAGVARLRQELPIAFEVLRYLLLLGAGAHDRRTDRAAGARPHQRRPAAAAADPAPDALRRAGGRRASRSVDPAAVPLVLGAAVGLAVGGACRGRAASRCRRRVLFVLALIGLSSLASTRPAPVVRDRRRGELLALVCHRRRCRCVGDVAGLMHATSAAPRAPSAADRAPQRAAVAGCAWQGRRRSLCMPSRDLHGASVLGTRAATPPAARAARRAGRVALAPAGLGLRWRSAACSTSPGASSATAPARSGRLWNRVIPGLRRGARRSRSRSSGCAAHAARARRSCSRRSLMFVDPRGAHASRRHDDSSPVHRSCTAASALAVFGAFICLLSILPFAMNQFAVDKAGLTLAAARRRSATCELLLGKAVGNGAHRRSAGDLLRGPGRRAVFPAARWRCGCASRSALIATYVLAAPAAAALSALFPRSRGPEQHRPRQQRARGRRPARHAGFSSRRAAGPAGAPRDPCPAPAGLPPLPVVWCALAW